MVDVFEVADALVSHAVENYGDEVDLIAFYGSHARGDARPGSDLDFFYTPRDGKRPPIGRTFLLDGLLFDFWELGWETLRGFATGTIRGWAFAPALVRQATPLHVRSPAQADRLASLKAESRALERPECRPEMQRRARDAFAHAVERLGRLHLASRGRRSDVSCAAWGLVHAVWECLALVNQVTFERGFHRALAEPERLAACPPRLLELIGTMTTSPVADRVLCAADELVASTRRILQAGEPTRPAKRSVRAAFDQVYPEMRDIVRKLLRACADGDEVAASLEAYSLQTDVTSILRDSLEGPVNERWAPYGEGAAAYVQAGFPDLMALASGPLDILAAASRRLDDHLRSFLRDHGVSCCEFATVEELRSALQQVSPP